MQQITYSNFSIIILNFSIFERKKKPMHKSDSIDFSLTQIKQRKHNWIG